MNINTKFIGWEDLAFSRRGIKKRKPVWLEHDDEGEMDPRRNYRGKWRLLHIGPCEKAIVDSGFYSGWWGCRGSFIFYLFEWLVFHKELYVFTVYTLSLDICKDPRSHVIKIRHMSTTSQLLMCLGFRIFAFEFFFFFFSRGEVEEGVCLFVFSWKRDKNESECQEKSGLRRVGHNLGKRKVT